MIHTRTKIIALVSLGLCLLACVAYAGFFWMVKGHKERLYEERLRAAEAEVQARALSSLEDTVVSSADDREKLKSYILANESVIEFVSLLEQIASEQGVTLVMKLEESDIDDMFQELQIGITMRGPLDNVMRMLRIIESIPEQSIVQSVVLTRSGEAHLSEWQITLDLRVTKFRPYEN